MEKNLFKVLAFLNPYVIKRNLKITFVPSFIKIGAHFSFGAKFA